MTIKKNKKKKLRGRNKKFQSSCVLRLKAKTKKKKKLEEYKYNTTPKPKATRKRKAEKDKGEKVVDVDELPETEPKKQRFDPTTLHKYAVAKILNQADKQILLKMHEMEPQGYVTVPT